VSDHDWQAPGWPAEEPRGADAASASSGSADPGAYLPPPLPGTYSPPTLPSGWTPPPKPGLLPLRPMGFGTLWRRAAKRIGPLIGWTLLVGAALLVGFALVFVIVLLGGLISPVGLAVGIVVALLLGLGLIVLGAWLGVKLALVPSIIVLEHAGIRTAAARSWRLTDGFFWRTFGTLLLVAVILNFAAQVVVQPVSLIGTILALIIDPTGTGAAITITIITTVVTLILSLLIGAITAVVQAALIAVIYIDLRMRKEGLDLELERHVELRDAGRPVDDPYRAPDRAGGSAAGTPATAPPPAATPPAGSERPATWS
jgi:hypothetical protein